MTAAAPRTRRLEPPTVPTGRLTLQPPPELQPSDGISGSLSMMLPMLGSLGSIVFIAVASPGPRGYIAGGMFLVATLGFVVVSIWRQRSQHQATVVGARREYLAYLAELRTTVRQAARAQRRRAVWDSPDPRALAVVAEERSRVWERLPDDVDFLRARVGEADQPLCLELEPPETAPLAQLDPVAASAAHRFLVTHEIQHDVPFAVDVRQAARVEITGTEEHARALARALVLQLATFHSPEHLRVVVLASPAALPAWDWAKWLPHAHSPAARDAVGPARMIATSLAEVEDLLPEGLDDRPRFGTGTAPTPHVLVVVDGGEVPAGNAVVTREGVLGVTTLDLPERWTDLTDPRTMRLNLGARTVRPVAGDTRPGVELLRLGSPTIVATADQLSVADAEAAARRLTPLHVEQGPRTGDTEVSAELTDLLGVGDVRDFDPDVHWRPRLQRDRLRVPIGLTTQGQPLALDIKESAQQGMGPHGLIIGATGSGKSEVLRTLVLALAMTHSSEDLNFVLIDFKGGATFAGMADMPHVSAIITNLGEELSLVDRMQEALQGEMTRRQELLRAAGNFANVTDYEKARAGGRTDLPPLPALLIVADEFSELLSAKPEFVELFVAIGRLGRSLQMHLLLSSQRLEEGRLRGLESHLSYRIGLRTFSAAESRTVLGVPDAHTLPPVPGMGYLKPDTTSLVQFRASYVSGPPPARRRSSTGDATRRGHARIEPFTVTPVLAPATVDDAPVTPDPVVAEDERVTFDIAVQRMKGHGLPAHKVWLEPLVVPATFDQLMPDLTADPRLGLVSPTWRGAGDLVVPLGVVDRPLEQRRENLTLELGGAAGHVAIVGGPRSGKSTAARSLVAALSLTRTPQEVQVYVLDFGGGTFSPFQRAAHVAGVASRAEPDVVRRIIAEIDGIVDARELYFRQHGIDSIETYRQRREDGLVDDGYGDVFLVVDGWSTIRAEFDELEPEVQALAGRGLTFGLHLVATANRWMDFRTQVKDVFGTKLELRLGDPMDSEVDRKVAANVPAGRPGRGLTPTRHHVMVALPRVDANPDEASLGAGVDDLVRRIGEAWTGPAGPKLRLLPERIDLEQVRAMAGPASRDLLLGIDEAALGPVGIDPREDSHLYAFGDSGSGKSALLRAVAAEVRRLHTPQEAQVFAVDLRRSLLGEIPEEYLAGYLTTAEQTQQEISALADYLRGRLPGPDVTPEQLRARSWWSGAEVYVLVDDYDLVATSTGNPLTPLVPLLAQARDVGLHLVLTRRSGGASRAMFEPVLQALRDLAAPGLVLSGSPDEGPLIGSARPAQGVPGRAQLVTRERGRRVVQLAFEPASH